MKHPLTRRVLRTLRMAATILLVGVAAADTTTEHWDCGAGPQAAPAAAGRLLVLPGVGNTTFHLAGFVERAQRQLPEFAIDVRPWGTPFLTLHNLRAHARNVATAQRLAAEVAAWRRAHPDEKIYVVGYSGGGGMVTLMTAALPDDVAIDRLILVAPAISPDFPLAERVLPHVREFVVNYASDRDLQVGWGTRTFGTIDREYMRSAGAVGFELQHERLLQHYWSLADRPYGHHGNHLSYLNRRWQDARLLPALDLALTAEAVRARWATTCKEK